MKKILFMGLTLLFLTNCASVNSLSITQIPADRSAKVTAEKSKMIILGFNFDNDFVDELVEDLKRQCPNGKVTGLLTKDENIYYFSVFVWKKQITANGFCVPNSPSGVKNKIKGNAFAEPVLKHMGEI